MASESPFDRLGSIVDLTTQKKVALTSGIYENAFTVAHKATGEWRNWRSLLESNGIYDPFDLSQRTVKPTGELRINDNTDDLTLQLGTKVQIIDASAGISGNLTIVVDDIDAFSWNVRINSDALGISPPVILNRASFLSNDIARVNFSLPGGLTIAVDIDLDTWLVLWLGRCFDLISTQFIARSEIFVTPIALGLARGENV